MASGRVESRPGDPTGRGGMASGRVESRPGDPAGRGGLASGRLRTHGTERADPRRVAECLVAGRRLNSPPADATIP
jgi:hypothetical protein